LKNIVSFSGGKDSTAMLLMMIEKQMQIDEIIFCDTGKEFPAMYAHIKKVEKYIGRKITVLRNDKSFDWLFGEYRTTRKSGQKIVGKGWMSFNFRWCTGDLKKDVVRKYLKGKNYVTYIGFAADEWNRKHQKKQVYPLQDWNITEAEAIKYCYSKGFNWDGLYDKFVRVSCYCCPLQRLGELKTIYFDFPELWEDMRKLDSMSWRKFRTDYSLSELEAKFERENELQQIRIEFT